MECHLSDAQVSQHADSFLTVLQGSLADTQEIEVRLAALRATAVFVQAAAGQAPVLTKFKALQEPMIKVAVDGLKKDEDFGKTALEAFVDLSQAVPEYFKESAATMVIVVGDIVRNDEFEDVTKSQACEVVLNLTEAMPAVLRKVEQVKSVFWPALIQLLARCEDDSDAWEASLEDEAGTKSDAYSTAVSSISRLAVQLKEKHTLAASTGLIAECMGHEDWKAR